MLALWLLLVVGCVTAGGLTGTKSLTGAGAEVGQSAAADRALAHAGLGDPAVESILVRSGTPAATRTAAAALERRARTLPDVASVRGPADQPQLSRDGGRTVLVRATLRGGPDQAADRVVGLQTAVNGVRGRYPGVSLVETGDGTIGRAIDDVVDHDLQRAELISLPITLVILVLAFGALVAALVPLLLGITSVAAALGLLGVISQFAPMGDASSSLVVLIGLAVGIDYSLFYIRREREERRSGRESDAALDATAATVGHAVVVSGLTVIVALAGLLVTGLPIFSSMALATIAVVVIAVAGSLTVLPATLALLGDRVNRGRIPILGKLRARRARRAGRQPHGAWASAARAIVRRPGLALGAAICLLVVIAAPAIGLHTASAGTNDLPANEPVTVANGEVERAFPGAPATAQLVVTGGGLGSPGIARRLERLGLRAAGVTGGSAGIQVRVAGDGRTAVVSVPMPDRGSTANAAIVARLRDVAGRAGPGIAPGARVAVTGDVPASVDLTNRLRASTPIVIVFVLGLAFVLLLAAFGSVRLAAAMIGLNLLSVGAAYGVMVAVFQHHWAEHVLDFTSNGTITDWLPLFVFVILFGLSMDYTVLVLERIREAREAGRTPRQAAADGVGATAGTVTSAAVVMVAIFAIFGTLRLLEMKELGVGLGVAVLLDATLIRGVALPAVVALLGERGIRAPDRRRTTGRGGWTKAATPATDAR
ncbi:MAG TPA: MMPL family transporter [Solirubrobacteraceae bacterium]|jgi:RND superfamily putative drug exporter|nr:MMPL family transporter [Solirubrobacteraceae bacterium]